MSWTNFFQTDFFLSRCDNWSDVVAAFFCKIETNWQKIPSDIRIAEVLTMCMTDTCGKFSLKQMLSYVYATVQILLIWFRSYDRSLIQPKSTCKNFHHVLFYPRKEHFIYNVRFLSTSGLVVSHNQLECVNVSMLPQLIIDAFSSHQLCGPQNWSLV